MSRYLVLLSTLGAALADYNSWGAPADETVTKIISRTAYVCPCDGSTSYGPDWNVWEGPKTGVSATIQTGSDAHTWTTTPLSAQTPSASNTRCYTTMGTNSGLYGTSWSTSYTSCTSTITSTVNTTTTMVTTSTITDTATVTTTSTAPTDTLTSTTTETDTATTTTTETDTATTTTTTTTTTTSTVAASSGFVPIQSSLPGSSYAGSGGADPLAKRDSAPAHAAGMSRDQNSKGLIGFSGYPNGVSCVHWAPAECSSLTTTVTSTLTQSSSTTVTTTVTTTSTSTVVPSATTTVTATTTTTTTATATTTTTSTETDTATATATPLYAACATNNLADTLNGQILYNAGQSVGDVPNRVSTSVDNAYDCCVAALLTSNSVISGYVPANGATDNCVILNYDTCPNAQLTSQWQAYTGDHGMGQLTFSNQNCGQVNSVAN